MEVKENFIADTNGRCFFCSKVSAHQFPPGKLETSPDPLPLHSQHHSLQQLSSYLRLNMSKVFTEGGTIPVQLLEKVTRARLQVELCEVCVSLNEKLSRLFRKLEGIEMEVISCINMMHLKLMEGNTNTEGFIQNLASSSDWNLEQGKRKIVEGLRDEVMQKCQQKIIATPPRVKIQRLSMKKLEMARPHMRVSSRRTYTNRVKQDEIKDPAHANPSSPELEVALFKVEEYVHDPLEDDDRTDSYFDDNHNDSESEDKEFKNLQTSATGTSTMSNTQTNGTRVRGRYSIISATNRLDPGSFTFTPQTKKYNCNLCSVEYGSHRSFKEHYNTAHLHAKWKCNICGKLFNNRRSFSYHDRVVHRRVRLKCRFCDQLFTNKRGLEGHIQVLHLKQKFVCQFCPKSFSHSTGRSKHIRKNHCKN